MAGPSDHMNSSMYSRRLNPQGTPESEFNNFECFQNYTAPEVFVQGLAGIVDQRDVELMIRAQKHMLQRFEKTNEMLLNCNALSVSRLKLSSEEFKKHSKLLAEMKKDLDYIFKKIRTVKSKISAQYPEAFAAAQPKSRQNFAEEEGDDRDVEQSRRPSPGEPNDRRQAEGGAHTADQQASSTRMGGGAAPKIKRLPDAKKSSSGGGGKAVSIDYVQIAEQSPVDATTSHHLAVTDDGGLHKRRSLVSNRSTSTENSNDSSDDGTSDTG